MPIWLHHEYHGWHPADSDSEVRAMAKNGWRPGDRAAAHQELLAKRRAPAAESEPVAVAKKKKKFGKK